MFIGITGTICSGVSGVASFLIEKHGFKLIDFKNSESSETDLKIDYEFNDAVELDDFVTKNWDDNFVCVNITNLELLTTLLKRPFFLHITIDSPLSERFSRYKEKSQDRKDITLQEFSNICDRERFANDGELIKMYDTASIKILNTASTVQDFYQSLDSLNLIDKSRLRPSWDSYFMQIADLAAMRSNCMKRRVGCVIMREKRVIATGYNGTPRNLVNCNEGGCSRCNSGSSQGSALSTCLCLHAEENALLESGRDRIGKGAVLYCNTCPCLTCSIKIVQCGIEEVVYSQSYYMDDASSKVLKDAGVKLRQFIPPKFGVTYFS